MIKQTKGKIFLAEERGVAETEFYSRRNTFNFAGSYSESKKAFADLYVLNDEALAGNSSIKMKVEEVSHIIILPVAGALQYKDNQLQQLFAAGQAQLLTVGKGFEFTLTNPFKDKWISFFQLWIKADKSQEVVYDIATYADVNENLNRFVSITEDLNQSGKISFLLSIGKFSGRGETVYKTQNKNAGLFFFVIEGAFETEGRLLHPRDGLGLYEMQEAETEALSENAIILVLELPTAILPPA